jgi:hypothetical protein
MRSWGNRDDTIVVDEPFYAHYLESPGSSTRAAGSDPLPVDGLARVAESLLAPLPPHVRVLYQKQMAHHLLPHMGREWLDG